MVFDFFGEKKKVVISMAHIGALPGSPLFDADGGIDKLIEDVSIDIEQLQSGDTFGNSLCRLTIVVRWSAPRTIRGLFRLSLLHFPSD